MTIVLMEELIPNSDHHPAVIGPAVLKGHRAVAGGDNIATG